jgi:hypothetical protein
VSSPSEVKDATEELAACYRGVAAYGRRCAAAHTALAETYGKLALATARLARPGGPEQDTKMP